MKQLLITIAVVLLVGCSKPPPPDISIWAAAMEGNIEAVKQHLAAGTDVNLRTAAIEDTPLHRAVSYKHKEVVELLINKGADLNAKDSLEQTPLHEAIQNKQKEIASLLINKGANLNIKDFTRNTPLDLAILYNEPETADLLRKNGAKTAKELKAEGK